MVANKVSQKKSRKDSPTFVILESNKAAISSQKKKKTRNVSEINCYSYNKKGNFTSNCTKNAKN